VKVLPKVHVHDHPHVPVVAHLVPERVEVDVRVTAADRTALLRVVPPVVV